MTAARDLISRLDLAPHPEGGWYRETWRAPTEPGARAAATAILFLLEADQASHWHKVDAAEIWCWHDGGALTLRTASDDAGPADAVRLGPDIAAGEMPQAVVPAGHWQAAASAGGGAGYSLVSCIVAPGFDFAGFTLAPPGWEPGA